MNRLLIAAIAAVVACNDAQTEGPLLSTTTSGGAPASTGADDGASTEPDTDSATSTPVPASTSGDDTSTTADVADGTTAGAETSSTGEPPPFCGNAIQEGDELCDLSDLGGHTCDEYGFQGGTLVCYVNCMGVSTELCNICGNGELEGEEDCEGVVEEGVACDDLGFDAGEVTCGKDCHYDTSQCSMCGNGIAEGIENCDADDLGGATCESIGFEGGDLACAAGCTFNLAGCTGTNVSCAEQVLGNVSPQTVMGTTVGEDDDFVQSCGSGGGPDFVLVFIAPSAGTYTFDAIGSTYDTVLSLHQSCDGVELACSDDFTGNPTCGCCSCSQASATLADGEQIIVAISGYNGGSGSFVVNVTGP